MNTPAFLFDLNGTMVDDMQYHISAWYEILNGLGAGISMERTKEECYGKNHELLERIFPGRFSDQEKEHMSQEKEKAYRHFFQPHLRLIAGLDHFLQQAHERGIRMAIGSAAIRSNIDFVLDGTDIRHYFSAIISADDVARSKPHPETFLKCAAALGVAPDACIVFEDAPKGVEAARNAGMQALVLTTMHTADEFGGYPNIIGFARDFTAGLEPLWNGNAGRQ